jgi:uncharacterized protein YodC (DUF2158 family)
MSNAGINKGQRVQLKSGGPVMTVESIFPDPYGAGGLMAHCVWFDKSERMQQGDFAVEMLTNVDN